MCIAIPKRVVETHETLTGLAGTVERDGRTEPSDFSALESVNPGDIVLVFRGTALRVVAEDEARKIDAALACLADVMSGGAADPAEAFADIETGAERLPAHLAALVGQKA